MQVNKAMTAVEKKSDLLPVSHSVARFQQRMKLKQDIHRSRAGGAGRSAVFRASVVGEAKNIQERPLRGTVPVIRLRVPPSDPAHS